MAKSSNKTSAIDAAILSGKLTVLHPDRGTPKGSAQEAPATQTPKAFECKIVAETDTHIIFGVSISKQAFRDNCQIASTLINLAWQL